MRTVRLPRETAGLGSPKAAPACGACMERGILGDRTIGEAPDPLPPGDVTRIARIPRTLMGGYGEESPRRALTEYIARTLTDVWSP